MRLLELSRHTFLTRADIDGPISGARAIRDGCPDSGSTGQNDAMLLDDTKHTTYIHDLDLELAESENSGRGLVLLPLAARMISVPESILSNSTAKGKELVLYTEPSSLSVPKEQDSVRRAILESRARARAGKKQPSCQSACANIPPPPSEAGPDTTSTHDDDPMDIDIDI